MKNYFYFSKGQKIGIIVLFVLVLLMVILNELVPFCTKHKTEEDKIFMTEVQQFKSSLKDKQEKKFQDEKKYEIKSKLFVFNPNTLDSAGFVSLGIKPKIAHNILSYRAKGGYFKNASDFLKIYGIRKEKFEELFPYISIPTQERKDTIKIQRKETKKTIIVELNSCDTTQLKELKGIGSSFAERIVKYRHILGGYANKEQLKEVYGLTSEKYDEIEKFIYVDTTFIKKIAVNKASVERLKSHKYINFYAAKAIYEQRKKLGKLSSKDDLRNLKDLPEQTLQKILPYISFE